MYNINSYSHLLSSAAKRDIQKLELPEILIVRPDLNNPKLYRGVIIDLIVQATWYKIKLFSNYKYFKELINEYSRKRDD